MYMFLIHDITVFQKIAASMLNFLILRHIINKLYNVIYPKQQFYCLMTLKVSSLQDRAVGNCGWHSMRVYTNISINDMYLKSTKKK